MATKIRITKQDVERAKYFVLWNVTKSDYAVFSQQPYTGSRERRKVNKSRDGTLYITYEGKHLPLMYMELGEYYIHPPYKHWKH